MKRLLLFILLLAAGCRPSHYPEITEPEGIVQLKGEVTAVWPPEAKSSECCIIMVGDTWVTVFGPHADQPETVFTMRFHYFKELLHQRIFVSGHWSHGTLIAHRIYPTN
jgi:hypothetical protein